MTPSINTSGLTVLRAQYLRLFPGSANVVYTAREAYAAAKRGEGPSATYLRKIAYTKTTGRPYPPHAEPRVYW